MTTFGVITLSFNQGRFIRSSTASVLTQNAEITYVIVDPGSTDGSREILADLAQGDTRIELVLDPDNGPADGLNAGLRRLPSSDYFCYLNADDVYLPGCFEYVDQVFRNRRDIDVLLASVLVVRPRKAQIAHSDRFTLRRYAYGISTILQQGTFFRRSVLGDVKFNSENATCWDSELLVDLAIRGASFGYDKQVVSVFNVHPASITGSQSRHRRYLDDEALVRQKALGRELYLFEKACLPCIRMTQRVVRVLDFGPSE